MESLRRRGARPRSGVAVFWLDLIFMASVFTDVLAQAPGNLKLRAWAFSVKNYQDIVSQPG